MTISTRRGPQHLPARRIGHATETVAGVSHEGDCIGTRCPDCGCCIHCAEDDHCAGCHDDLCGCSL